MGNIFYKKDAPKPFIKIKDMVSKDIYLVSYYFPGDKIRTREMEYDELLFLRKILKVPVENTLITRG